MSSTTYGPKLPQLTHKLENMRLKVGAFLDLFIQDTDILFIFWGFRFSRGEVDTKGVLSYRALITLIDSRLFISCEPCTTMVSIRY